MQQRIKDLHFDALRSAIYHSSRRRFLDLLNRTLSFVVVASGSVALVALWYDPPWFAAAAALAGLLQLVFDFGGEARSHEFLQRRFYELIAEITETLDATDQDLVRWKATLIRLYGEELPPMRALDAIAYNAAVDSLGYPKEKAHSGAVVAECLSARLALQRSQLLVI